MFGGVQKHPISKSLVALQNLYEVKGCSLYEVKGDSFYEVKGCGLYEVKGSSLYEVKGDSLYEVKGCGLYEVKGCGLTVGKTFGGYVPPFSVVHIIFPKMLLSFRNNQNTQENNQ